MKAHWETLSTADLFTIEVARPWGLITYDVLFFTELSSWRVYVAEITQSPAGHFTLSAALNLADLFDSFLLEKRHLIVNRDRKHTVGFGSP